MTFSTHTDYPTGSYPVGIAVGDFNGDGMLDIATANQYASTASVLLNTGSGFATHTDYPTEVGSEPLGIAVGDFNGDGMLDIATAIYASTASVLLNLGDGFATYTDYPVGSGTIGIAVGDFNGDGKPDITTANWFDSTVSVLLNSGDGFATHTDYPVGNSPCAIAVGDFNGDGKIDIATANNDASTASVLLNLGNGFATHTDYPVGNDPLGIAVGDFNGDGKIDIATANFGAYTASVLLNLGDGFATHADYPVGNNPQGIAVGDFNGDGKPDIATANQYASTASVLLNTGSGFATHADYPVGTWLYGIAVGDFNGDGKPDIATANAYVSTTSVLLNTYISSSATQQYAKSHTRHKSLKLTPHHSKTATHHHSKSYAFSHSESLRKTVTHIKTHRLHSLTHLHSKSSTRSVHTYTDEMRSYSFFSSSNSPSLLTRSGSLSYRTSTLSDSLSHRKTGSLSHRTISLATKSAFTHKTNSTTKQLNSRSRSFSPTHGSTPTPLHSFHRPHTLSKSHTFASPSLTPTLSPSSRTPEGAAMQPAAGKLADGGSVVTWTSFTEAGVPAGIFGQIYNSDRSPRGASFQIGNSTAFQQQLSSVAGLTSGDFVVAWQQKATNTSCVAIVAQQFNSTGQTEGAVFPVSSGSLTWAPRVTALNNGGFTVVWSSAWQNGTCSSVYGRIFNSTAFPLNGEFKINNSSDRQIFQDIVGLTQGGFVVVWTNVQGEEYDIYGQLYDNSGAVLTPEFRINTVTGGSQGIPSVTALAGGGFVVVWEGEQTGTHEIYGQLFKEDGSFFGSEFQVTANSGGSRSSKVIALENGGFSVMFQTASSTQDAIAIFSQQYSPEGMPEGSLSTVSHPTRATEIRPTGVEVGSGFMSIWQSCSETVCSLAHRFLPSFVNTTFPSLPPERRALEREEVKLQGERAAAGGVEKKGEGTLNNAAAKVEQEEECNGNDAWNESEGEESQGTIHFAPEVTSGAGLLRALPLFSDWEAARRLVSGREEGAFVNGYGFGHAHAVRETVETVAGHLALGAVLGHVAKKIYAYVFPH